jgi:Antirestriction protein (ArdA).
MEEMRVYLVNLGTYNEGNPKGAWFTLPIDYENVKEKLGLNGSYEKYLIHDYELPFAVGEYEAIAELNKYYEMIKEMKSDITTNLKPILKEWFCDMEELYENRDKIIFHAGCSNMEEFAVQSLEESGALSSLPETLRHHFNYASYARDMEVNGFFLEVSGGILEYSA